MAVNEHLEEENKALRDRVRGTHSRMVLHASERRKVPEPSASQTRRDELSPNAYLEKCTCVRCLRAFLSLCTIGGDVSDSTRARSEDLADEAHSAAPRLVCYVFRELSVLALLVIVACKGTGEK